MKTKTSIFPELLINFSNQQFNIVDNTFISKRLRTKQSTNIINNNFNPNLELKINYEHIFLDNLYRFPQEWLYKYIPSCFVKNRYNYEGSMVLNYYLRRDPDLYDHLISELKRKVYGAISAVKRDINKAIPYHYKGANTTCFLLPLKITSEYYTDLCLCVRIENSIINVKTVLTIKQGFYDAKNSGTVNSTWLEKEYYNRYNH